MKINGVKIINVSPSKTVKSYQVLTGETEGENINNLKVWQVIFEGSIYKCEVIFKAFISIDFKVPDDSVYKPDNIFKAMINE